MSGVRFPIISSAIILIGTAIGAGIFALPYVVMQSGYTIGITHIIILGTLTTCTFLAYASVITHTRGTGQFVGYAKKYLPPFAALLSAASLIFGIYSALIAYIIKISDFFSILILQQTDPRIFGISFWLIASILLIIGLSAIIRFAEIIVSTLLLTTATLLVFALPYIQPSYFTEYNWENSGTPYGVILFAFTAASAIPEIKRILTKKRRQKNIGRAILLGMGITGLIYILFTTIVIGISGKNTSEAAILGMVPILGEHIQVIGAIFGITAMASSYLIGSIALKHMYQYDYTWKPYIAVIATTLPPLGIYLLNWISFIQILSIAGAITGGLQGFFIWEMYIKIKEKRKKSNKKYWFPVPVLIARLIQAIFTLGILFVTLDTFSILPTRYVI